MFHNMFHCAMYFTWLLFWQQLSIFYYTLTHWHILYIMESCSTQYKTITYIENQDFLLEVSAFCPPDKWRVSPSCRGSLCSGSSRSSPPVTSSPRGRPAPSGGTSAGPTNSYKLSDEELYLQGHQRILSNSRSLDIDYFERKHTFWTIVPHLHIQHFVYLT